MKRANWPLLIASRDAIPLLAYSVLPGTLSERRVLVVYRRL